MTNFVAKVLQVKVGCFKQFDVVSLFYIFFIGCRISERLKQIIFKIFF